MSASPIVTHGFGDFPGVGVLLVPTLGFSVLAAGRRWTAVPPATAWTAAPPPVSWTATAPRTTWEGSPP